ncbi:MAG TPA: nucleotidyltransferase family protein [Candidatus Xenobia bacterium]|nr:nucleotidyltransferase family protein [Candidatus Xenobia bacterium]
MSTPADWRFPVFASAEVDRAVLALCSPRGATPAASEPDAVLARAAALDLFPLAFHRLRHAGRRVNSRWEESFRANAARNLWLHHEQARLLELLRRSGVCAAPLKGTSLAELAHGDLSLRTQVDIDLHVSPPDLGGALEVLESAGYRRTAPAGVPAARLAATGDEFTSECSLESTAPMPLLLELHWRILPLRHAELRAALRDADTLPPDLNFLYLSLRAAADRWGGLKLLSDLAHWLERRPPEWPQVLAAARRLGLRRILCLTLDALRVYFGTTVPAEVEAALASARPRRFPPAGIANPFEPQPPQAASRLHRLRLALHERRRDQVRYLLRLLRPSAGDLAAVSVPGRLGFLYWGVRWLRLSGLLKGAARHQPATAHS